MSEFGVPTLSTGCDASEVDAMKVGLVVLGTGPFELADPRSPAPALADALAGHGHDVTLIARRRWERPPAWLARSSFAVHPLEAGPPSELDESGCVPYVGDFVRRLDREIRTHRFDVLHSHGWLAGLATQLAAKATRVPVVHTFRGLAVMAGPDSDEASSVRKRAERACARHADHLTVTTAMERDTLTRIGVRRDRITVVPPGVHSPGEAVGTAPDVHDAGPDDPHRGGRPRVVVFGPPAPVANLLRALPSLPEVELVVCSTDATAQDNPDDAVPPGLRDLVGRLGLAWRVRFESPDTNSSRAALIRGATIVVCLSSPTSAGTEHLEAMASGAVVVAGNAVSAEAVVDGVSGVHIESDDPRHLASVLKRLLSRPVLREQLRAAAQDRADTRYTWDRLALETLRVYQRVHPADRTRPLTR